MMHAKSIIWWRLRRCRCSSVLLSSKTNDDLSLASLELAEYSEKAFFVCQKSPDKQMVS